MPFFPISQATLIAFVTTAVGNLVAWIPSFAPYEHITVSAVSTAIAVGFFLANALHHHATAIATVHKLPAPAPAPAPTTTPPTA